MNSNPVVSRKVFSEIAEKTNASSGMYAQKTFKEILRSMISIFSNVYYVDKNSNSVQVKCFHSNQERAIAKTFIGDNVTLPVITIGESSTAPDEDRQRYYPMLVHESKWDEKKNKAIRILSMVPRPVNITYKINIWAKYRDELDQIREAIFLMFNPDLSVYTNFNSLIKGFIDNETEIEQAVADDQKDRILKKTISVSIESYIPNPKFLYTSTGKIEKFNFELDLIE